jgi:hypothetical protein
LCRRGLLHELLHGLLLINGLNRRLRSTTERTG